MIRSGVSDHDIIIAVRKLNSVPKNRHNTVLRKSFKNFNRDSFLKDLKAANLENFENTNNPNAMWNSWKGKFQEIVNKHAPLKRSRTRYKKSPWMNDEIIKLIRKRDALKRKAIISNSPSEWLEFTENYKTDLTTKQNKPKRVILAMHFRI